MGKLIGIRGTFSEQELDLSQGLFLSQEGNQSLTIRCTKGDNTLCAIVPQGEGHVLTLLSPSHPLFLNNELITVSVALAHEDVIHLNQDYFLFSTAPLSAPPIEVRDTPLDHVEAQQLSPEHSSYLNADLLPRQAQQITTDIVNIVSLTRKLQAQSSVKNLAQELLQNACEMIAADQGGVVFLLDDKPDYNAPVIYSRNASPTGKITLSRTIITKALESRNSVFFSITDKTQGVAESIRKSFARQLLAAPLLMDERVLGVLYFYTQEDRRFAARALESITLLATLIAGKFDALQQKAIRERELTHLLNENVHLSQFIGNSPAIEKVKKLCWKAAAGKSNVLILGESGTGKEVVAQIIHNLSVRNREPFCPLNCGAIPDNLIESELFGYEKGAFTGANQRRIGLLQKAGNGTVFFDELGEMPLPQQASLLRVLDQRTIRPLGSTAEIPLGNLRFLAATNKDLPQAIKKGEFREDLYYRFRVITITLPPLRERKEDIPALVRHFIQKKNTLLDRNLTGITDEALTMLMSHRWPGNIRELENAIERAINLNESGVLGKEDFDEEFLEAANAPDFHSLRLDEAEKAHRRQFILNSLQRHNGNLKAVAEEIGYAYKNIHRLLKDLTIREEEHRD